MMNKVISIVNYSPGRYVDQFKFKNFIPSEIDGRWDQDSLEVAKLLADTNYVVGRCAGYMNCIQRPASVTASFVVRSAVSCAYVDGGNISFDEAYMPVSDVSKNKSLRLHQVHNHIKASTMTLDELNRETVSVRVIRNMHKNLLADEKHDIGVAPGMYRVKQAFIGGASMADATYIPPHPEEIVGLFSDLDRFLHSKDSMLPPLLRIGVAFYQILTIHPFAIRNSTTARLCTQMMFQSEGVLPYPLLDITDFLERNRTLFFDNLMYVRKEGKMEQWLKFFLVAVKSSAEQLLSQLEKIVALNDTLFNEHLPLLSGKNKWRDMAMLIEDKPVLCAKDVAEATKVSMPTANTMIEEFRRIDLLCEITGQKKNRIFVYKDYIDIFN